MIFDSKENQLIGCLVRDFPEEKEVYHMYTGFSLPTVKERFGILVT